MQRIAMSRLLVAPIVTMTDARRVARRQCLPHPALVVFLCVIAAGASAQTQTAPAQTLRINVTRANLRASASTNGRIVASLARGTELEVLERVGTWYHVKVKPTGVEGYVSSTVVEVVPAAAPSPSPAPAQPPPPPAPTPAPPPPPPAKPAPAQPRGGQPPRTPARPSARPASTRAQGIHGDFSVNGVYQTAMTKFQNTIGFTLSAEAGSVTTNYALPGSPGFDVAGHIKVWRDLSAGVAIGQISKSAAQMVNASLPHPFFFNQPRAVSGSATSVKRQELGVHVQVAWSAPFAKPKNMQLSVFGGPSFIKLTQGLVTDITYSDQYPYDTAAFVSATVNNQSKSGIGFNGGVDVTYMLSPHIGVGGLVRYSRASLILPAADGGTVNVIAGGAQAGGGVRVQF